jgi:glycosyltransferase involved in cell wall biosynthesis
MLIQTIESVNQQDFNLSQVEIIVVSQTPSIQELALEDLNVSLKVIVRPETETISALRNYGVKESSGEHLAFLDADIYLSANWIQGMLHELHSTPSRIITSAVQVCEDSAPSLEKIRTHLSNVEVDVDVNFLPGRNLFMSRESFYKIGGFPEHLVTCEDYFFTDKAAKIGTLFYTSKANYIHLGEDKELGAMFSKEIWRGQSNLQSLQGRNIPLREWPSLIVPPAIFCCLILACILFICGLADWSSLFLLLALIPVSAYTLRLWRIAKSDVSLVNILLFYAFYFPARALGTFVGVFKTINVK